ncbi:MAG: methionine--tRNA ligase subunit beta, partial [Muribaculaceae bacterium]
DVLRYVLTANAPETKDNDFTWRDFQSRNNSELVAILGNYVNRVLVLTHKYYGGTVPAPGEFTQADLAAFAEVESLTRSLSDKLENFHFRDALRDAMGIARLGNRYLQETEPWKTVKTDPDRVATVMYVNLQLVASLAIALDPFMPFMGEKLRGILSLEQMRWSDIGRRDIIASGHTIGQPELLFDKIDDEAIQAQLDKLEQAKRTNAIENFKPAPQQAPVSIDAFGAIDLRVGTITACEAVKKSDKLLKLTVDDGMGGRTIVSGIAKSYTPAELVGRQVVFVANLPTVKLRGVESQGMVLCATNADGSIVLTAPAAVATNGAQIK